jgi:hypothetical protein
MAGVKYYACAICSLSPSGLPMTRLGAWRQLDNDGDLK